MTEVYGLMLAGGLARRMGGSDKPLSLVGGRTVLARIIDVLNPQCRGVILNANGDPGRFAATGLPVVADSLPDRPGPLAGLLAGLDWVAANAPHIDRIVTVPGDAPFLPNDLVARLATACHGSCAPVAVAASADRVHWTVGLWPVSLRFALLSQLVEDGMRRVADFAARHGAVRVTWTADPVDPFFNANAPDDLVLAERLARLVDGPIS